MNSALDFIQDDIAKTQTARRRLPIALGLITLLLTVAMGLWLRDSVDDSFALAIFLPNLALMISLLTYSWIFPATRKIKWLLPFLGVAAVLSFYRAFTASVPTVYASGAQFWAENLACLAKGAIASALAASLFAWAISRLAPTPSRPWRIATSVMCGMIGVSMLSFHCDSSSVAHLTIAHWGQALFGIALSLGIQRYTFRRQLKKALGASTLEKMKNSNSLG